jgi:hypothetical protein
MSACTSEKAVSSEARRDLLEYAQDEYTALNNDIHTEAALIGEERQLATRLQAANIDLYGRYERLLVESSFR